MAKMTLLVRSRTAPALPAALRAQIWSIDRDLPASNIRTLAEIVDAQPVALPRDHVADGGVRRDGAGADDARRLRGRVVHDRAADV